VHLLLEGRLMAVKVYGPYEDKSKGGRKKMTIYNTTTKKFKSTNAARYEKEKELGKKLPKSKHVDHKDNNKHHDGKKNLQVMDASKNIAKGNQHRKKKAK
jgi:hypothetical protein